MPPKEASSKRTVSTRDEVQDSDSSKATELEREAAKGLQTLGQGRRNPVVITEEEDRPRNIARARVRSVDNEIGVKAERFLTRIGFIDAGERRQFFENLSDGALANIDDITAKISKVMPLIHRHMPFLIESQFNELVKRHLNNVVESSASAFTSLPQDAKTKVGPSIVNLHPDNLFAKPIIQLFQSDQTYQAHIKAIPSRSFSVTTSDASKLQQEQDNAKRAK